MDWLKKRSCGCCFVRREKRIRLRRRLSRTSHDPSGIGDAYPNLPLWGATHAKYNNQDHAMMTGCSASKTLADAKLTISGRSQRRRIPRTRTRRPGANAPATPRPTRVVAAPELRAQAKQLFVNSSTGGRSRRGCDRRRHSDPRDDGQNLCQVHGAGKLLFAR